MKELLIFLVAAACAAACGGKNGNGCDGACEEGLTRCSGNAVQTCEDHDGDGCADWGGDTPCTGGQTCVAGVCTGPCTDECELSDVRCAGEAVQSCWDYDGNGCLEWGGDSACPAGQTCRDGRCVTDCTDECTPATQRCQGNAVQVCDDYDGDGCAEWGADTPCAAGETCQYGICFEEGSIAFYVSPAGSDAWSGHLPEPDPTGTDGPLLTMAGARDAIRALKDEGPLSGPVRVLMRGGTYPVEEPVELLPEDSGTSETPITYEAFPGETPVISGGRAVTGFAVEGDRWTVAIPAVAAGAWDFAALWVDGGRRPRAAKPNDDYLTTAGTADPPNQAFRFSPGDIESWSNPGDVIVEVFHSWATSLHHIQSVDTAGGVVTFTGPAAWAFEYWGPSQRYRVENVFEELDAPGEWYLDRSTGVLTYLPLPGEDPAAAQVVAPVSGQLIVMRGEPAAGIFVANIALRGLTLMHTDWQPPPEGSSAPQAAIDLGGALEVTGGRSISIEQCRIGHVGTYAVWLRSGTQRSEVTQTEMADLGGGGVRIGETSSGPTAEEEAGGNRVDNCFIHDGGVIQSAAVGVWIGRSSNNEVTHNEICDLDYTGVSVGWSWGYEASSAHHNIVADNHIHDIGRRVLSDMGGVYTLGISSGTEVKHNRIHDVFSFGYGGWGLYNDEGSTDILLRDNLVYNTKSGGYHQHYGRDNQVLNNILAFSHTGQIRRSREEEHNSFSFMRNIVVYNNGWLLDGTWENGNFVMDANVYWDLFRSNAVFGCMTLAEWQAAGHDPTSVAADPLFADAGGLDFTLDPASPALALGFTPFDLESFGLYGDPAWTALPAGIDRPENPLPSPAPDPFSDGFETTPVGENAADAVTWGETAAATIRVTDEAAATGSRSLKFQDAPGLDYSWNPHLWYVPGITGGEVRGRFSVRLGSGAVFYHEWRDARSPYHAGPSIFILADGSLTAGGVTIGAVARDEWVTFEITCDAGMTGDGLYDMTVTSPSLGTQNFTGLGTPGAAICGLEWLGFVSNADAATVMYLDDVSFQAL